MAVTSPKHRRPANLKAQSAIALLLYSIASVALFGIPALRHPSHVYLGYGTDPATHMWFLAWWPYAISHGLDPFVTHVLWAPTGYNLGGSTAIPGPSLLLSPITETLGPVVAYNILALLCPAVSAWAGYLLCRHVTGNHPASLVGGWLFGFSTYEMGQLMGHPNLALVFLVPVAVLLALRRIEGSLRPWPFVLLLALTLFCQFLISGEVLLTLVVFGAVALLLALLYFPRRAVVLSAAAEVMVALVIAFAALGPYLVAVVRGLSSPPIYSFYPFFYASDLENFAIPNPMTAIGGGHFTGVAATFSGNVSEQTAYLGVPLIVCILLFAGAWRRRRAAWFLMATLLVILVASLGPRLRIGGAQRIWLPWRLVVGLPFIKYALPARFMLYGFLLAGLIVALWLAGPASTAWTRRGRWTLALLAVAFLLPTSTHAFWRWPDDTPAFFSSGIYRQYLQPGENTLVIPFAGLGTSMLWQARTSFWFRMPEGYVSVVPPSGFAGDPFLKTLASGIVNPDSNRELAAFIHAHDVTAIVLKTGSRGEWRELFRSVDPAPVEVGGVVLYRVPSG
jgi:hypothetical protein